MKTLPLHSLAPGNRRSPLRRASLSWALAAALWSGGAVAAFGAQAPAAQAQSAPSPAAASKAPAKPQHRFEEQELKDLLTHTLNQRAGGPGAEWELRFTRPWMPTNVPDDMLTIEIVDPALSRITPSCVLRFELRSGRDLVGSWQMPVQARLWREVLVARSALSRGQSLSDAAVETERRDVLSMRDPLGELPRDASAYEIAQTVPVGAPLLVSAVRLKPVVYRGQLADAVVQNGAMMISLKVEVLEEGAPGQMIRVRNPQSRRELRGKVQDERTISIVL